MGNSGTKECQEIQQEIHQGDAPEPKCANGEEEEDITLSLPYELSEKILEYLPPRDLSQFSQVCVNYREVCNSDLLWHHHCLVKGWERFGTGSTNILNEEPLYIRPTNVSRTSPLFELHVPEETRLSPVCKWKKVFLMANHLQNNWRLGRYTVSPIMREHKEHLCSIASEGYTICSGGQDKQLRMWDMRTSKCTRVLRGHTDAINEIVIRGNEIITACRDCTVRVYDRDTCKLTLTFTGHTNSIEFMRVVDHLVITASADKTVRVWCLKEKRLLHTFRDHDDEVESMAVHGRRLMTGSWDLTACMWDLDTGRRLHRFHGHTENIPVVEFDDIKALSGGGDGDIRVWSLESGECINVMSTAPTNADVYCLVYNAEVIVAGYADSIIRVWSHEGKLVHSLHDHLGVVRSVFINDQRLVSSGDQNKIVIWDYREGKKLMELHRHPTKVQKMLVFDTRIVTMSPETPGTLCVISFW